ncbi:hypothetical protein ROP_04470 [Rhodococcus opacus B4]|uniref:Lsr2 DNA-binding domain-containing protein n=2 Tax=Rhodococcus opacus TaxID=37919 RepID=C1ARL7_RHOOB|nr:hypothetical protein ROP_04470 [Rhodococcus opacus B4]
MMTRLQVAIAVIVGYWLGRTHHTKPGMMLAAAGAGRLAGSPQEMVDHAAKLLQASPEFAALDESVRGQLLDAVRVAAVTAGTARADVDTDIDRLLPSGSDDALRTAEDLAEDTAALVDDIPAAAPVEDVPDDIDADIDIDTDNDAQADDAPTADDGNAAAPAPSTAEVRTWAREHGFPVSDRGRLRAEVWEAFAAAHPER